MILDFSSLGSGAGNHVDLCPECKYFINIRYRSSVPTVSWLTGEEIMLVYGSQDVKIAVRGIKGCKNHGPRRGQEDKAKPAFLRAALRSGININENVDDYRTNILRQRHPVPMERQI